MHLVYSNSVLMEKDKSYFSDVVTLMQLEEKDVYHANMDFNTGAGDLLIFDEGDEHIFGSPEKFMALTKDRKCVVYTATSDEGSTGYETALLKHMDFQIYKSGDE